MKMPLLICTDFDGTLTSHEHAPLASEFFEQIEELRRHRPVIWVVNTGRNWDSLVEGIESRNMPIWPDWAIVIERHIYEIKKQKPFGLKEWNQQCDSSHNKLFKQEEKIFKAIRDEFENDDTVEFIANDEGGAPIGLFVRNEKRADEVHVFLNTWLRPEKTDLMCMRNAIWFRFSHRNFHKGSSLETLCKHLELEPRHCFAAGDHHNDIHMLDRRYAHHLTCPGNAVPAVKEHLLTQPGSYIAEKKHELGVLEALEHFFG